MATQILDMGDFNVAGICHAISCQWIKKSRVLGDITDRQQLGSPMAMFMNWQLGNDWQAINDNFHLPTLVVHKHAMLSAQWIAERSTRINGFALIVLWGGGINVAQGSHDISGHTVAVRKQAGHLQYFDPNLGTWSFASTMELYDWLQTSPSGPYRQYPTLRNRECEFVIV